VITAEDVKSRADMHCVFHARLSVGGYLAEFRSRTWPELMVTLRRDSRRDEEVKAVYVGEREIPRGDFGQMAEALNELVAQRTAA
jgi:hypothetical protein